jgi:single-stranded DNA-binding protein
MIDGISGKLCLDSELKVSQNGNPYCRFALFDHVGEPDNVVVSGIAFGETAERIAKLGKGDAISVCGALKPTEWTGSDGQERPDLNVTVSGVLSVYDIKKWKSKADAAHNSTQPGKGPGTGEHDFDDDAGMTKRTATAMMKELQKKLNANVSKGNR